MSSANSRSPKHCPSRQIDMVCLDDDWRECPKCRLRCKAYLPSPEQRAETRATFQQWRRLLFVVAELHDLGYEYTRIVPHVVDTAGGGDWCCIIAPADMISTLHGARIAEHIDWWNGTRPPGEGFPYYIGRAWRGYQPTFETSDNVRRAFPQLAEQCLARDNEYVEWYREMLRATMPEGVVYVDAYWDEDTNGPANRMRVLKPEGGIEIVVPLPPPGRATLLE